MGKYINIVQQQTGAELKIRVNGEAEGRSPEANNETAGNIWCFFGIHAARDALMHNVGTWSVDRFIKSDVHFSSPCLLAGAHTYINLGLSSCCSRLFFFPQFPFFPRAFRLSLAAIDALVPCNRQSALASRRFAKKIQKSYRRTLVRYLRVSRMITLDANRIFGHNAAIVPRDRICLLLLSRCLLRLITVTHLFVAHVHYYKCCCI